MAEHARTHTTYFYESWRAVTAGILETAGATFLLTIAVKWFHAGAFEKGIVAGAGSLGLLVSPVVVSVVTAAGSRPSQAASRILALGATAFLATALFPSRPLFIVCSVVAMASSSAIIPLLTHMYQENYPEQDRGRRFSRTVMLRIASAALFAKIAGDALSNDLALFRWLFIVFAAALTFASFCLARCPTHPILPDEGGHLLRALRFVREDALFRRTLVCWMLMGFANLMMLPLRVEYLANSKYHNRQAVSVAMIGNRLSVRRSAKAAWAGMMAFAACWRW